MELRGVELRYSPPPSVPTVPAFSMRIEPARRVGLLGRSGAGKSTIAKALARLLQPSRGEVLLGGRSLDSFGEAELRRAVSCVPQSPHIFSGSLRDNLDPTGAQDDRALAKACAQVGVRFAAGLDALTRPRARARALPLTRWACASPAGSTRG